MSNSKYKFEHKIYESIDQMDNSTAALITMARQMTSKSYAPYSSFYVGAAVLLSDGTYHGGCNQENASYPLCICAERVALYNFGTLSTDAKVVALAVTAHNPKKPLTEPCMPCGACRQVIQEFEQRQSNPIDIYMTTNNISTIVQISGIDHILPQAFNMDDLI